MKLCRTQMIQVCLLLLLVAAIPAFAQQHGTLGIDFGEISDRFGALPRYTDPAGDVNGEFVVLHGNPKDNWPSVLAGGEIRFPSDTQHHATEFALHGGLRFRATSSFSIGFDVGVRRIYVPPSTIQQQVFNRYELQLLETPLVLEYKFGPEKRVFVRAEGAPEFTPHFRKTASIIIPTPQLDHGYFIKGSVGYNFGKWYAKGSYESRYFKYSSSVGNPSGYNNWRTDFATVGAGLNF